jgi:hypothetical protein
MGLDAWLHKHDERTGENFEVFYWRKENHIHAWFVERVGGDNDQGEVPLDTLKEFLETCKEAVKTYKEGGTRTEMLVTSSGWKDGKRFEEKEPFEVPDYETEEKLNEILPTQGGFFFGSTNYTKWYLKSLESILKPLEAIIDAHEEGYKYYYSSWW